MNNLSNHAVLTTSVTFWPQTSLPVYIYIYTYIHMYINTHIYIYIYILLLLIIISIITYIYTYIYIYIYTCINREISIQHIMLPGKADLRKRSRSSGAPRLMDYILH